MIRRSLLSLIGSVLLAYPVHAADPDIALLSGMTCKGFFSSSLTNTRTTQGAVWFEMSKDGTPTAHFWRKWGKEAVASYKPTSRDSEYEDRGIVTFSAKGGKIVFSISSTSQTFYWEFTPTTPPNSFLIKVTGGNVGTEGRLDCTR